MISDTQTSIVDIIQFVKKIVRLVKSIFRGDKNGGNSSEKSGCNRFKFGGKASFNEYCTPSH
ncbi:hypothetical protein RIVM261_078030 [Rivularia sp. IAM M-261]|nr:hypothetical protein RIVM261_078030 [Rivularia sp. IAM M-261]